MTSPDKAIGVFRCKVAAVLASRQGAALLAGWCLLWGLAVLILRLVFRFEGPYVLWGLGGVVLAAAAGLVWAMRMVPSASSVRALLDGQSGLGGLLMTQGEIDIGRWDRQMHPVSQPPIRWRWGRSAMSVLAGAAFVAAAVLIPQRYLRASPAQLQVNWEVQKLSERIEVLKDEQILPPEKAEAMQESLEQLRDQASGADPARTLEALDHMEQSVAKLASESAEAAAKAAESSARAEELAQAIAQAGADMDPQTMAQAAQELAKLANQAALDNKALAKQLAGELGNACSAGQLDPNQLKELCEKLGQCKSDELAKLGRMCKAGLASEAKLGKCQGACQGDPSGLAASMCSGDGKPGQGGVSRGRGDAAMTWSEGASAEDVQFKETPLAPGASSPEDSSVVAVSAGNPSNGETAGPSIGGALNPASGGTGAAYRRTILPQHRRTVQRYFDRPAN